MFLFLVWLLWGIYVSTGEEWFTVLYIEQTSEDTFIARVSGIKVLVGILASTLIGFTLYLLVGKSKRVKLK